MLALTETEYGQAEATSVATQQQESTEVARLLERTESVDRSNVLSLDNIRQSLIRQEDSIIFSLIERSQFAHNQPVYEPDSIPVPGYAESGQRYSLLDYLLQETEQLHGKIRRYTSPDEHPFFPDALPPLVLPPITYSEVCCLSSPHLWVSPGSDAHSAGLFAVTRGRAIRTSLTCASR